MDKYFRSIEIYSMSIVKTLSQKTERRKFLEIIKHDLEFQMLQYQKKIYELTSGIGSIKSQIEKVIGNINDLNEIPVSYVEPTHSDPSIIPEIVVKTDTIHDPPDFDKRVGLPRRERLKVSCAICGDVLANRIRLKEHKYQKHSL
jgi:hypothetical protein